MKSIIFGLSLASVAVAQIANGVSMVPVTAAPSASPSAVDNSYGSAPQSQVTAAPSSSSDFYQVMPYSSYQSGGYKSLNCGYGYSKSSDGSCQAESWVCAFALSSVTWR